jgi:hypothetical protein
MIPKGLLTGVLSASCSAQRSSSGAAVRPIPAIVRTVFCCADAMLDAATAAWREQEFATGVHGNQRSAG